MKTAQQIKIETRSDYGTYEEIKDRVDLWNACFVKSRPGMEAVKHYSGMNITTGREYWCVAFRRMNEY